MLTPNHSPFASEAWNNPVLSPFIGLQNGEALAIGEVSETTALGNMTSGDMITPLGPINSMMALRHQFPYLQVLPWTNEIETVALVQNVPYELRVPTGAAAVIFQGSGSYFVCNQGNASIPQAGGPNSRSLYKPERFMFLTVGMAAFSLISGDANAIVTAMFFAPREFPTED